MTDSTKKLEIATKTISIKVIQVDGHKMTKATFDQILIDEEITEFFEEVIVPDWEWSNVYGVSDKNTCDENIKICNDRIELYFKKYIDKFNSNNYNILGWINLPKSKDIKDGCWILINHENKIIKIWCESSKFNILKLNKFDQLYIAT